MPLTPGKPAELVLRSTTGISPMELRVQLTVRPDGVTEFMPPPYRGIAVSVHGPGGKVQTYYGNAGYPAKVPMADPLHANFHVGVTGEGGNTGAIASEHSALQDSQWWKFHSGGMTETIEDGTHVFTTGR
jgi:hypothetical protein